MQTAPIRSGSVESRAIEARPSDPPAGTVPAVPGVSPGAAPTVPPPPAVPAAPPPPIALTPPLPANARTAPRGTKVPFSDAALADLRAAETAAANAARTADPKAADPKPGESRPAEAPSAVTAAGDGEWTWPASGRVLQSFSDTSNKGITLAGRPGDPIVAVADGRVIFSGNGPRGYGNLVIVKHPNDLLSVYAHNRSLAVKEGQSVKRGQKIAELGDSGATSPRLHFEIRQQGKPVDPTRFLPRR